MLPLFPLVMLLRLMLLMLSFALRIAHDRTDRLGLDYRIESWGCSTILGVAYLNMARKPFPTQSIGFWGKVFSIAFPRRALVLIPF